MRHRSRSANRAVGAIVVATVLTLGAMVSMTAGASTAAAPAAPAAPTAPTAPPAPAAPAASTAAPATAAPALSAEDRACLECHGSEDAAAKHAKDGRKAGVVPAEAYARSLHADVGCSGCHESITLPEHPDKSAAAKDPKAEKATLNQVCRSCHRKIAKAYDRSFHAQRMLKGKSGPACSDCHAAHEITQAGAHGGTNSGCSPCHDDAADTHRVWLPNAVRHLQTVACNGCHSPLALTQVDLRLSAATRTAAGGAETTFEKLAQQADRNRDGLDAGEFRALLEALSRQGTPVTVGGRIEPRSRVEAHQLPEAARAVRDCFACHDRDASPYKRVTVSMLDADGAPVYYDAHQDILTSAITIEALKGFYVLGGTRMSQLDLLLALTLGIGISVPALHFIARRVWGRARKHQD